MPPQDSKRPDDRTLRRNLRPCPAAPPPSPRTRQHQTKQVEEVLDPSLRGKPIGIRQKYLLVTCNYTARSLGVRKMESLVEVRVARVPGAGGGACARSAL